MQYCETEISDAFLYRLSPNPFAINENGISGQLFVDGNLKRNCLLFRFRFDAASETVPVVLRIKIAGKFHRYLLDGKDLTNPMVKSPVLFPEADISEGMEVLSFEPLLMRGN